LNFRPTLYTKAKSFSPIVVVAGMLAPAVVVEVVRLESDLSTLSQQVLIARIATLNGVDSINIIFIMYPFK